MTGNLAIWRVGAECALWALAIALIAFTDFEGFWFWVACGAAVVAGSLRKGGRGGGGGGGSDGGWFGDGGGDGGGGE